MCGRVSGVRLDSLQPSDTNLPQANCNEIIESSLIDRKNASPSGVNDTLTPNNHRISH
ncbi:hypothetical protein [uncultured Helicobacter sp.]|uniref:hypothetical protein n=1 Tax=uncultured Helicobacter sp. TaxID=175537 RepID=UPI00374EC1FA